MPFIIVLINFIFAFFQVENTEIHAHRNVLACVSPYLMELFSAEQVSVMPNFVAQEQRKIIFVFF
jgi:hypothetical protein